MQIKWKSMIIMFFIIYFFAYALSTCSSVKADEPEITCEAFVKEEICKMTPEEQEIWFLELLKKILENVIEEKKTGIDT